MNKHDPLNGCFINGIGYVRFNYDTNSWVPLEDKEIEDLLKKLNGEN